MASLNGQAFLYDSVFDTGKDTAPAHSCTNCLTVASSNTICCVYYGEDLAVTYDTYMTMPSGYKWNSGASGEGAALPQGYYTYNCTLTDAPTNHRLHCTVDLYFEVAAPPGYNAALQMDLPSVLAE
jgi:hypothetical protein